MPISQWSNQKLSPPSRGEEAFARDLDARLGTYVKRAEQAIIAEKSVALREYDLSIAQYATLMTLYYMPGQSAAQLARIAAVTPQTMANILSKLEDKHLIDRIPSTVHSRVNVITLTAAGEALALRADEGARKVEQRIRDEFTPEESAQLRDLLRRLTTALRGKEDG
ncbi:MarR family winged helix-turn-helix transcriptional regulator [Rothia nasisuis]|uniref:MarR family winged helix-turn-helix transcriptional regulator n=1 Tax=Rothia nasisuis TaxID=2109647 RepID=UPI001F2E013D|nr:MarR family winged helix-turn-helix transcriptional regulator [Rothia nasisuis]